MRNKESCYLRAFKAIDGSQRSPLFRISMVFCCFFCVHFWICQLFWMKNWSHSLSMFIFCLQKNPISAFLHPFNTSRFGRETNTLGKVLLSLRRWSCDLQIRFIFGGRFSLLWSYTTFGTRFLTWIKKINYLLRDTFVLTNLNLSTDINTYKTV